MSCEETRADAFSKAKKEGLQVIFPLPNQLFIDIDSDADFEKCRKRLKQYKALHHIKQAVYARSKSNHFHVYVLLAYDVSDCERIALQACFGSDLNRETLSMKSILDCIVKPTVFFAVPKNPKIEIEL